MIDFYRRFLTKLVIIFHIYLFLFFQEYKLPDVISFNNDRFISNNSQFDQENIFPSNSNYISFPFSDKCAKPSETHFVGEFDHLKKYLSEDSFSNDKENIKPVDPGSSTVNSHGDTSLYDDVSQKIIGNGEALLASANSEDKLHMKFQKHPKNSILEDTATSKYDCKQKHFQTPKADMFHQNRDLFFSPYYPYSYQNFSNCYSVNYEPRSENQLLLNPSGKYFYQPTVLLSSNLCPTDYFLNPAVATETSFHALPSETENIHHNASLGSPADKMNIDVENLSDSNLSSTNFSDSSNSLNVPDNCHPSESPFHSNYDSINVVNNQSPSANLLIKKEPGSNNLKPNILSPLCSNFKNNHNNTAFTPFQDISQLSYFGNVFPHDFDHRRNHPIYHPSESFYSSPVEEVQNNLQDEHKSLYSPWFRSSPSKSTSMLQSESDSLSSNCLPGSSQESNAQMCFQEEISIPLAEYLKNC